MVNFDEALDSLALLYIYLQPRDHPQRHSKTFLRLPNVLALAEDRRIKDDDDDKSENKTGILDAVVLALLPWGHHHEVHEFLLYLCGDLPFVDPSRHQAPVHRIRHLCGQTKAVELLVFST